MLGKRVLVIGRVAAVNQRVVARLTERGFAATGAAGEGSFPELDAREFDLVAMGAGIDAATRSVLKDRFRGQRPDVLLLDAYGPLATEQVITTLRRAAGELAVLELLSLEGAGDARRVRVTLRRPCRLRLDVNRHRGTPEPEVLSITDARLEAGTHGFGFASTWTGEGHLLVARIDDDEVEVRGLA